MEVTPESRKHFRFLFYLYAGVAILLAIGAVLIPKGDDVLWINGHHSPGLDILFASITHLGEGWIFVPIILWSLFVRFGYSIAGLSAALLTGVFSSVFKRIFFADSLRPSRILDPDLLYFVPGVEVHGNNSFP